MKKVICYLLVIVSFFSAFYGCKNKPKNKEVIKVGVILPLSGDVASYGNDCKNGIIYANSIDSLAVEYVFEDSKGDPKTAIAAYNKLISIDNVDYVIGDMFSNTTLSLSPLAKKHQKLLISPTASSKDISKNNIYALSVFPCESYESELVANFVKNHYSKVGVLYEKVAAAQAMRDTYIEHFEEKDIAFDEAFESNITNFRDVVFKIKNSGCEVLYLVTYTNNAIRLIEQMKEFDCSIDIVGQSALYDPSMFKCLMNYKSDFYLTGPLFNICNEDSSSKSFINGYYKCYNKEPNQMSAQGYVAAIVARELYESIQDGSYSREKILSYSNDFFGSEFRFDNNLTSLSGLRMYKFNNENFCPLFK